MEDVDDEGRGCGEEDVAVVWGDGHCCHCCGLCWYSVCEKLLLEDVLLG